MHIVQWLAVRVRTCDPGCSLSPDAGVHAGCLDIGISSYVKHRVGYYLNSCDGNGNFGPVVIITTNALNSRAVRAADIDVRSSTLLLPTSICLCLIGFH